MGCTLAPPGEYDWTVLVWLRCGLMSNYFDHLLRIVIMLSLYGDTQTLFRKLLHSWLASFTIHSRKASLEVTPTILATFLADCNFFDFHSRSAFQPSCQNWFAHHHFHFSVSCTQSWKRNFAFCDRKLWPITFTLNLDLDRVKLNRRAKYLGQRSFCSKVIIWTHRKKHTHNEPIALPGLWHR